MRYFFDTEFHEYKKKQFFFSKGIDTIELISIGIVSENGREYYAISKEFDVKRAWQNEWLRLNVLKPIFFYLSDKEFHSTHFKDFWMYQGVEVNKDNFNLHPYSEDQGEFKRLINKYGKTNQKIACEIYALVYGDFYKEHGVIFSDNWYPDDTEFYAYYADYDWVVFCWIFGRMIDLPKGFPMYCKDLKQMSDELYDRKKKEYQVNNKTGAFINELKNHPQYPRQVNEHNALDDARWNFELYKFINTVSTQRP